MTEKVQNKKVTPMPSEDVYNDSDKLNDLLLCAKNIGKMYGTFAEEASNDMLFKEVGSLSKEMGQLTRDSFNLMFEKGWYSLEHETPEKIQQMKSQFQQSSAQLH